MQRLHEIEFRTDNFKAFDFTELREGDFVYADPPYLITTGSYNDGKRGFEGWSEMEEIALYDTLDELDRRNIRFALSNVIEHKGRQNAILEDWRNQYNTHYLNKTYGNSSYVKNLESIHQRSGVNGGAVGIANLLSFAEHVKRGNLTAVSLPEFLNNDEVVFPEII